MKTISRWGLAGLLAVLLASCTTGTPLPPSPQPRATETLLPSTPTSPAATATDAADVTQEAWDYVTLGDSFTEAAAWPEIYASYIEEDLLIEVTLHQEARSGEASSALRRIRTDDSLRRLIMEAEVITVNIVVGSLEIPLIQFRGGIRCGGSDGQDCLRSEFASVEADWSALMEELVALRGPEEAHIVTFRVGSWLPQVICDWGSECWEVLLGYFLELNDSIERVAIELGVHVVDVNQYFTGADYRQPANSAYLESDEVHVSEDGSVIIADLLRELGLQGHMP